MHPLGRALAPSAELTQPFAQNRAVNLGLISTAEPFKDFLITLNADKRETGNYREIFRNSSDNPGDYISISPNRSSSYSITTIMIGEILQYPGGVYPASCNQMGFVIIVPSHHLSVTGT